MPVYGSTVTETRPSKKVWVRVADELRSRVEDGTYPPDGRFPSETDLVQEFGIARGTARKIVAKLREEGLIYTEPQVGSFVMDRSRDVADKSGE
jgi:DNA-binding GntR family transcriptional regulator